MKRGALNLSIQAIVILVLAMLLLSLGVGFIRNFFSDLDTAVGTSLSLADLSRKPTADEPLLLQRGDSFTIKSGETDELIVGIYNNVGSDITTKVAFSDCTGVAKDSGNQITFSPQDAISKEETIAAGQGLGFKTLISAKCKDPGTGDCPKAGDIPAGTYICTFVAKDQTSNPPTDIPGLMQQVTMTVTS